MDEHPPRSQTSTSNPPENVPEENIQNKMGQAPTKQSTIIGEEIPMISNATTITESKKNNIEDNDITRSPIVRLEQHKIEQNPSSSNDDEIKPSCKINLKEESVKDECLVQIERLDETESEASSKQQLPVLKRDPIQTKSPSETVVESSCSPKKCVVQVSRLNGEDILKDDNLNQQPDCSIQNNPDGNIPVLLDRLHEEDSAERFQHNKECSVYVTRLHQENDNCSSPTDICIQDNSVESSSTKTCAVFVERLGQQQSTNSSQQDFSDGSDSGLGSDGIIERDIGMNDESSTLLMASTEELVNEAQCKSLKRKCIGDPCSSSNDRSDVVEGTIDNVVSSESKKVVVPARGALKRKCIGGANVTNGGSINGTDVMMEQEPACKRTRRSVAFDNVTVYYFPRAQGFCCVPSQGGSTLGMSARHISKRRYTISEHRLEQRRSALRRARRASTSSSTSCAKTSQDDGHQDDVERVEDTVEDNNDDEDTLMSQIDEDELCADDTSDDDDDDDESDDDESSSDDDDDVDCDDDDGLMIDDDLMMEDVVKDEDINVNTDSSNDDLPLKSRLTSPQSSQPQVQAQAQAVVLLPVSARRRRALLRASGVRRIDAAEREDCRTVRASREFCGCDCRHGFCDPETCSCSRAGVKCQVDRPGFPCGCSKDGCANTAGRTEFNPTRVRTHFIHTLMRLDLEERETERRRRMMRAAAGLLGSTTHHTSLYDPIGGVIHNTVNSTTESNGGILHHNNTAIQNYYHTGGDLMHNNSTSVTYPDLFASSYGDYGYEGYVYPTYEDPPPITTELHPQQHMHRHIQQQTPATATISSTASISADANAAAMHEVVDNTCDPQRSITVDAATCEENFAEIIKNSMVDTVSA